MRIICHTCLPKTSRGNSTLMWGIIAFRRLSGTRATVVAFAFNNNRAFFALCAVLCLHLAMDRRPHFFFVHGPSVHAAILHAEEDKLVYK